MGSEMCIRDRRACPCGGRDGRLPSRPPTQPAQGPNWDAPASSSRPLRRQSTRQVRSVWVCRSIGRSIGRVWCLVGFVFGVPGAGCLRGGSIPPPGVVESRRQDFFGVSSLLRVSRSVCGGVGKENLPGAGCLCGGSIPPPGVMEPALLGVAGWCCRGIGGCLPLLSRASARAAAIRSALCVVFGG